MSVEQFGSRILNSRFSDNSDGAILTGLSNVFNPVLSMADKEGDIDVVTDYLGTVGMEGYKDQVTAFCKYTQSICDSGHKTI